MADHPMDCGGTCHNACGYCGDACTGQASNGGSGCDCGTNCTGDCSSCSADHNCSSGCDGSSSGSGCSNCANECSGGCTETCQDACDAAVIELYNKLKEGLDRKILAADMNNINEMIQYEAQKRSLDATNQDFNIKEKATVGKVTSLQSTIKTIGYEIEYPVSQKTKILSAAGNELINKSLQAYEDRVESL